MGVVVCVNFGTFSVGSSDWGVKGVWKAELAGFTFVSTFDMMDGLIASKSLFEFFFCVLFILSSVCDGLLLNGNSVDPSRLTATTKD